MAGTNAQLRDALLESPVTPLNIPTSSADRALLTRPCLLCGWSLRETTGSAAASAEFEAAQSAGGPQVGEQQLATSGTGTQWLGDEGVLCEGGLFLHVVSGSLTGVAYVRV